MFPLPSEIGRYEIKSLIGRGGMGDLYLAWDPNTKRLVALKLLNATLDSSELRERFGREAHALAALNHPNIVNIYDTGEFENSPFIVMEYVRGETLAEMIKRRAAMSVSQKLKLMAELCAGLAQAHEAAIIHRDIKPANLIVDQQGRLKILDFGIARVAEGNETRVGGPLTQVNMTIGTPGYMSPEQIEGGEVDHRSDIFAVGAVCYELLSYNEAFSGADTRQVERRVLQGKPVPLASMVPGLDPEIDEIVLRALKKDPNKRYQDAATFERALERLRGRLEPDDPLTADRPLPVPPQSAGGRSRDPRAEAAYLRSLAADQVGAPEAARRFALEALAYDSSYARARALLERLDGRSTRAAMVPAVQPLRPPSAAAPPTVVNTAVNTVTTIGSAPTIGSRLNSVAAPTIIVPPATTRAAIRRDRSQAVWNVGASLRRRYARLWKREPAAWKRREPFWIRYRWALSALALLATVAVIATLVTLLTRSPSGQLLTITKPIGGTVSVAGISCNARTANCTVRRPTGDAVELRPEPEAGFKFSGYTGDCAPGGRAIMNGPRTCGATFEPDVAIPASTQVLTINPVPRGGTVQAVGILCGTLSSECSAPFPDGVKVELMPIPDDGYTFMGFHRDCTLRGQTQMIGPRTCDATFSPTAEVAATSTPVAPSSRGRDSRGSRNGRDSRDVRGEAGTSPPTPVVDPSRPPPTVPEPVRNSGSSGSGSGPVGGKVIASPPTQVAPPPTDDEFAKMKIAELLKKYCAAISALSPSAVHDIYPKSDMAVLGRQLNKSSYNSVACKFGAPEFVKLEAEKGTAHVRADLTRVYSHTVGSKADEKEQIADMMVFRPLPRSDWLIEVMKFEDKPK